MRTTLSVLLLVALAASGGYYLGSSRATAKRDTPRAEVAAPGVVAKRPPPSAVLAERVAQFGPGPANAAQADQFKQQLEAWAGVDPKGALAYLIANVSHDRQEQLVPLVLAVWARSDPVAAWGWLSTEEAKSLTFPTLADAVLSEASRTQPDVAWRLASEMAQQRPYDAQSLYVSALRGMLYVGNYKAAIDLVNQAQFPNGEGRYDLTSLIASDWGRYEPEKAAAWLKGLPEGFERRQAMISLGQSWAEIDAQRAADFAAQLPASLERASMLSAAVDRWVTEHPGQVGEWLLRYQQSRDFDQIVSAIATNQQVVWQNPPLAISWAESITDPDVRLQSLSAIFDHWLTRDDQSAKAFLLKSGQLSADVRDELRRRLHIGG